MAVGTAIAIGSLANAYLGNQSSNKQTAATKKQYQQTRSDLMPYQTAGSNALNAYTSRLGLGSNSLNPQAPQTPAQPTGYSQPSGPNIGQGLGQGNPHALPGDNRRPAPGGVQPSGGVITDPNNPNGWVGQDNSQGAYVNNLPTYNQADWNQAEYGGQPEDFEFDLQGDQGYQFAVSEAMKQANRGQASQGGYNSGNRLAALTDRASGIASQYADQAYNRQMGTSRENYNRGQADYNIRNDRAITDYNVRNEQNSNAFNIASSQERDLYGRDQSELDRLANLAGSGQNAAAQLGGFGAQATGQNNQANQFATASTNNAIQSGIGNYLTYDYLNQQNQPYMVGNGYTDNYGYGVG